MGGIASEAHDFDANLLGEIEEHVRKLDSILSKSEVEKEELLKYFQEHSIYLNKAYDFEPERVLQIIKRLGNTVWPEGTEFRTTKFHYLGMYKTLDLLPKIVASIKRGERPYDRLNTIAGLVNSDSNNPNFINKGVESLYSVLPQIVANINTFKGFEAYSPYLAIILRRGSEDQRAAVRQVISTCAESYSQEDRFRALVTLCTNPSDYNDACKKYFWKELEELKLPAEDICEAWRRASDPEKLRATVTSNFRIMRSVEEIRPGICEVLNKQFGIKNFGRYPVELLIDQYDHREDTDVSYGIILNPADDYTGGQYLKHHIFGSLYRSLKDKIHLRVTECESRGDFVRRLNDLDTKYNSKPEKNNKISLIYFGGHGSEDGISLGESGERQRIRLKDLLGSRTGKIKQFFTKNCVAILASCSTGKAGGFAENLASKLGFIVYSADKESSISSLNVDWEAEDRPEFDIEFWSNKSGNFKSKIYRPV